MKYELAFQVTYSHHLQNLLKIELMRSVCTKFDSAYIHIRNLKISNFRKQNWATGKIFETLLKFKSAIIDVL